MRPTTAPSNPGKRMRVQRRAAGVACRADNSFKSDMKTSKMTAALTNGPIAAFVNSNARHTSYLAQCRGRDSRNRRSLLIGLPEGVALKRCNQDVEYSRRSQRVVVC